MDSRGAPGGILNLVGTILQKDCGVVATPTSAMVGINIRVLFSTFIVAASFVAFIRVESHAAGGSEVQISCKILIKNSDSLILNLALGISV